MPVDQGIDENELSIRCTCGDRMQHTAILVYNPSGDVDMPDDWFLMVSLDRRFGFWRRFTTALRYLFRPMTLRYGGYAELVLTNEDAEKIAVFICKKRGIMGMVTAKLVETPAA